jgi:hypothetical protein
MRTLLIAVLCLLCAHMAFAECVEVTPSNFSFGLTPLPSSRNAQITVNLDGKPLPNAKLIVYTAEGRFLWSALADAHGVAELRDLKSGRYVVVANANEAGREILLDVSAKSEKSASLFSLDLVNTFALPYFGGRWLEKLEAGPSEHFPKFTGAVLDPSGAAVAGAEIEIYPASSWDRAGLVHLIADQDGHFFARLPDGTYRAIIHMAGFRPHPVVFRIQHDEDTKEFKAVLEVGSC